MGTIVLIILQITVALAHYYRAMNDVQAIDVFTKYIKPGDPLQGIFHRSNLRFYIAFYIIVGMACFAFFVWYKAALLLLACVALSPVFDITINLRRAQKKDWWYSGGESVIDTKIPNRKIAIYVCAAVVVVVNVLMLIL